MNIVMNENWCGMQHRFFLMAPRMVLGIIVRASET